MKKLKLNISYNKVKIGFYLLGFMLTIFIILKFGLSATHTPPLGFIIPVLIMSLGCVWSVIDWLLSISIKTIPIDFTSHYIGVSVHFIICVLIISLS